MKKKEEPNAKLKNLKPFKKGQSGNPLGGQLHDPVKKAIKKLTTEELAKVIETVMNGTIPDLNKVASDPNTTVLTMAVARAMAKSVRNSDWTVPSQLLERVIGKVSERVDLSSSDGTMSPPKGLADFYAKKTDS